MKREKIIKNGFTLIELLAVIIILGILMIIAIPSVTSYINNSRKSAYVDTAKEIVSGARNKVNEGKLDMFSTDTTYYIPASYIETENASKSPYGEFTEAYVGVIYDGKGYKYYWISRDETGQGVKELTLIDNLDEDKIESDIASGAVETTIRNTGIGNGKTIKVLEKDETTGIWNFNIVKENALTISEDETQKDVIVYPAGKDKTSVVVGDIVKIEDEEFYVISKDATNNKLTLLTHYNLNVGPNKKTTAIEGIQDSEVRGMASNVNKYGNVAFSSTNYWDGKVGNNYPGSYCINNNGTNCAYVYYDKNKNVDNNNLISSYINAYKTYLISKGAPSTIEARLMTLEESYAFKNANQEAWKETSYWLGSASGTSGLWDVRSEGFFNDASYSNSNIFGVRPVIVI